MLFIRHLFTKVENSCGKKVLSNKRAQLLYYVTCKKHAQI